MVTLVLLFLHLLFVPLAPIPSPKSLRNVAWHLCCVPIRSVSELPNNIFCTFGCPKGLSMRCDGNFSRSHAPFSSVLPPFVQWCTFGKPLFWSVLIIFLGLPWPLSICLWILYFVSFLFHCDSTQRYRHDFELSEVSSLNGRSTSMLIQSSVPEIR